MSDDLGDYIISAQDQAIERHRKFIVAISGSSLPTLIASGLINNPKVKWDTW
jgi:6-phosphogluconolactonase